MNGKRIVLAICAAVVALLVYAWIDGGREPVRPIAQPVELPEGAQ